MALPKAIQQQVEQAEALSAQLVAEAPETIETVEELAQQTAQQQQPSEPTKTEQSAKSSEDWEQRFRTIKGMYDAEVPELKTRVKAYESELVSLKEQIQLMRQQLQQAEHAKQAVKEAEPLAKPDKEDVETFGADLVQMVAKYSNAVYNKLVSELGPHVKSFNERLSALEAAMKGVSSKTDDTLQRQFFATLAQLVPDWSNINNSKAWQEWLAESDPVYRLPRQAALDAAAKRYDAEAVAAIFKAFKSQRPSKPADDLAKQVTPTGASSAAPVSAQSESKPLISQKFVKDFYRDVALNRYKGREAEQQRIEAQINLAAQEGRIV